MLQWEVSFPGFRGGLPLTKHWDPTSLWTAVSAIVVWTLANGLDILSALFVVQAGSRFAFTHGHVAEVLVIYAGLRILGTLGVILIALAVDKRWPIASNMIWGGLTVCALAATFVAWWRVYR
jgi:hypothetical protein